jgi:2,4-dienoyl-CoA reductase-like NADH-dependent reductase (Old Yellow Enzyme family)
VPEAAAPSALFEPLTIRGVTLGNRVGVSPMCMYASEEGFATDYHLVHLGRFALGGAGLVIAEATAVSPEGRISHRDLGLWDDEHVPGLARVARFLAERGAVAGIQLGHAGRRACVTEPWRGGTPVAWEKSGPEPWPVVGPSALAPGEGWPVPEALDEPGIRRLIGAFAAAANRAVAAGFRVIELHGAHGYLLHSFLSPLSNRRSDEWGGSPEGRARFPLEVVRAVRAAIPADAALFYRVSSVDGIDGGLELEDVVEFARAAVDAGVDVIDASSGGISTDRVVDTRVRRGFAFHADFSRRFREALPASASTVGLVVDALQAERLVASGDADIVLLARAHLDDPNWALHARRALGADEFAHWHVEASSALEAHRRTLARLADAGETSLDRFD